MTAPESEQSTLVCPSTGEAYERRGTDGYSEIYSNVRLGEPEASLMMPRNGEEIRRTDKPAGIVSGTFDRAGEKK